MIYVLRFYNNERLRRIHTKLQKRIKTNLLKPEQFIWKSTNDLLRNYTLNKSTDEVQETKN